MKKYLTIFTLLGGMLVLSVRFAGAQVHKTPFKPPSTVRVSSIQDIVQQCNTLDDEILLVIEDAAPEEGGVSVNVVVTDLETMEEVVNTDVHAETDTRGSCDWTADTEPPATVTPSPDDVLPPNIPYELEFTVTGGSNPDTYTYTYFNCYSTGYDAVDEGFYCPNGDNAENDLYFIYDGSTDELKVFPEAYNPNDGYYDDAFTDD